MIKQIVKTLAPVVLLVASAGAFAQSGNVGSGNTVSGNSGNLGSAALGIDFFAGSVVAGSNQENDGGLAASLEAAFSGGSAGGTAETQPTEAGKRKQ
jgi:hypothetical protein